MTECRRFPDGSNCVENYIPVHAQPLVFSCISRPFEKVRRSCRRASDLSPFPPSTVYVGPIRQTNWSAFGLLL